MNTQFRIKTIEHLLERAIQTLSDDGPNLEMELHALLEYVQNTKDDDKAANLTRPANAA